MLVCHVFSACYDDKGNYDYTEVPTITVENIPEQISLRKGIQTYTINPTITSSTEGEITADNPNFEFSCRIGRASGGTFADEATWHDLNPDKTMAFTLAPDEPTGEYLGVYTVTDKRTGVSTNHTFRITLTTSTYEGWMVLCNEGAENKVRLDMVSVFNLDDIVPVHDLLGDAVPGLQGARQLYLDTRSSSNIGVYMITDTGAYQLDSEELTVAPTGNVEDAYFIAGLNGDVPARMGTCGVYQTLATREGDFYLRENSAGSVFNFPFNATAEGEPSAYRVAPYVAAGSYLLFAYDADNHRFMSYYIYSYTNVFGSIPDPDLTQDGSYSWSMPGKDLVYMDCAGGIAYAVMQDASTGQRSVYAASLQGFSATSIPQTGKWENITSEGFATAEHFAFHSIYPYMFYSSGSKLHAYQLQMGKVLQTLELPGEEITMVKINLFRLSNKNLPEEKEEWQYYILVGSYRNDATDDNGGILRMYTFDNSTSTFEEVARYDGFARIADVTYRERKVD